MPYQGGKRLSGERASKLGHLEVIQSELVNELIDNFEGPAQAADSIPDIGWKTFESDKDPLRLIFAVDGSMQTIRSELPPYKELSFIKTALLRLDQRAVAKLDPDAPHPLALRDLMTDAAMYHATVLPLKGVNLPGKSNYHTIRQIVFDSLRDQSLGGEPYETLKWLAYEKWGPGAPKSPSFSCPHCEEEIAGLPFDEDSGPCEHCGSEVHLSDMIGFHLEMGEDAAPESVSTAYMLIHEMLLLFTGIRYFWEREKFSVLANALFLKDGPLTLRSQYSKLVGPIRRFVEFAKAKGVPVFIVGQEKTGLFVNHLEIVSKPAPARSYFVPPNEYIRREVQQRPERSEPYGHRTNYGNKIFVKTDEYHHLVLSIPTGDYADSSNIDDFFGAEKIIATLPTILSYKHECALVPIELANGVASLSSYPSAAVLKVFAELN